MYKHCLQVHVHALHVVIMYTVSCTLYHVLNNNFISKFGGLLHVYVRTCQQSFSLHKWTAHVLSVTCIEFYESDLLPERPPTLPTRVHILIY